MQTFSQEDQAISRSGIISILQVSLYESLEGSLSFAPDFSQASRDNLTAKDYFGLDPKGNGRPNHPKESTCSLFLKYGAIFSGIVIFIAS